MEGTFKRCFKCGLTLSLDSLTTIRTDNHSYNIGRRPATFGDNGHPHH